MPDKALVLIPAFNEAAKIENVIRGIKNVLPQVHILVINDSSTDATETIVRNLDVKIINLPFNLGYGAALQTGFKYALSRHYEYVVQIDADGQHDPEDIPRLVEAVRNGTGDVILGSRFINGNTYKTTFARRTGMRIFGAVASFFVGQKFTDPTSGFQAINRRALKKLYATEYYPVDYPDADVLIMLHRCGLKIREIPVTMYPDDGKNSMHGGTKPFYYIFKMFLSIFVTMLRKFDKD